MLFEEVVPSPERDRDRGLAGSGSYADSRHAEMAGNHRERRLPGALGESETMDRHLGKRRRSDGKLDQVGQKRVWLDGVHGGLGGRGRHRECEEADVGTHVHDDFAAASQLLEHPEQVGSQVPVR